MLFSLLHDENKPVPYLQKKSLLPATAVLFLLVLFSALGPGLPLIGPRSTLLTARSKAPPITFGIT